MGSAEDYGKPALITGYHARGVISPDFCVFLYVLSRDGAVGVLVCGLCRGVMGRYFHFVAWMAAVVLTFAGSCCQLPSSVADGGYIQSNPIQYNNNMNPNPESGIRNPNPNQNLKEERFSLFSIQSNPIQCNPTAAVRMIFGAAAWTREREFIDFSEKADRENGGRSCAPFFYLEDSGSGAEKTAACPRYAGEGIPSFAMGRPRQKRT